MRKLFVVLVLLAAVVVGALAVGTVALRHIVAQQRDAIIASAERAVGRRLSVGELDVHILATPSLHASALRVGEDPAFGDGTFLSADSARAHLRVWPLLRGRVVVSRLRVERPEIQLIRNATGIWNVSTLGSGRTAGHDAPGPATWVLGTAWAATNPTPPRSAWPVNDVEVTNGVVVLHDHGTQPPRQLRLTDLRVRLRGLSWDQPVSVALQAGVGADAANIHVAGSVGPLHAADGVAIDLTGDAGPFGALRSRLTDVHLAGRLTADVVTVTALTGHGFDGAFEVVGAYSLTAPHTAQARGMVRTVAVQPLLRLAAPDVAPHFDGRADARFDLQATGRAGADLTESLTGTITADVHDGKLSGMNLPSEIVRRVAGVQDAGRLLSDRTRKKYGRIFSDTTTSFHTMHMSMRVGGQRVRTDDLTVEARDYGLRARGWLAFDRRVDLDGRLHLSQQFSSDLAADVKVLRHVLDESGRVAVPFRLRGRLGDAYPEPDVGNLLEQTLRGLERGGSVGGLLDKLLGGKKDRKTGSN